MSDLISLSNEVQTRVDELCFKYDPNANHVFREYLSRIPSADDRAFFLASFRGEIRAHIELVFMFKGVTDYAMSRGPAYKSALFDCAEFYVPEYVHCAAKEGLKDQSDRHYSDLYTLFDDDPQRSDPLSETLSDLVNAAVDDILLDVQPAPRPPDRPVSVPSFNGT